jgi:hypothetical protein
MRPDRFGLQRLAQRRPRGGFLLDGVYTVEELPGEAVEGVAVYKRGKVGVEGAS